MKLQSYVFENKDNDSLEEIFNIKEESQLENIYNNYCNRLGNFVESRCENRILANALWFYYWLKDFSLKDICRFKSFINYLLDHLYLLPIELTEDSVLNANNKALKIFETINNRGMNLEDADIFKAKLYDNLSFSFLYTYNSCFSTLALAGRPLFLVVGLAFET